MAKPSIKLNTKSINKLLSCLNQRSQDIIERRFGIGKRQSRETLESIGKSYKITRERVRQIENQSISKIRKSASFKYVESILNSLKSAIDKKGGVVPENDFLAELAGVSLNVKNNAEKNCIYFLMVLGENFEKLKEDKDFHACWITDKEKAEEARKSLDDLHRKINQDEVFQEEELIVRFANYERESPEILKTRLRLSRRLNKNMLGEWGASASNQIKPRGVKDLAFLVMKHHGSPMHFTEVAGAIQKTLSLKAHPQTVHNELIKDGRFVLVGRGLYALANWGYKPGLIRDVIKNVLERYGSPLSKDEIIRRVLKERYVKENTIIINLNNRLFFRKNQDNTYSIA